MRFRKTRDKRDFTETFDLLCKSINYDLKGDFSKLVKSVAVNLYNLGKCDPGLDDSRMTAAPFLVLKSVLEAILRDMTAMEDQVVEINDEEIKDDIPLDALQEGRAPEEKVEVEALKVFDVMLSSFTSAPKPYIPTEEVPGSKVHLLSK